MIRPLLRIFVLFLGTCLYAQPAPGDATGKPGPDAPASTGPTLRVMSYNVRVGTAGDGINRWELRKGLCVSRAAAFDPDLAGLQESMAFQNDFFVSKLEGYGKIGVGARDGKKSGEFTTILYRKARLDLVDSGTFALGKTPEDIGKKHWDAKLPRIASWGIFKDLKAGGKELLFLNTHFDHVGDEARRESAKQIREFLDRTAEGRPVIVMGDFNAKPDSPPYRSLLKGETGDKPLTDTYLALHPEPAAGTAHGYSGKGHGRIDWIFCSPSFKVREAEIDRFHEGDRYPSDHFPITAVLDWP